MDGAVTVDGLAKKDCMSMFDQRCLDCLVECSEYRRRDRFPGGGGLFMYVVSMAPLPLPRAFSRVISNLQEPLVATMDFYAM